MNDPEFNSDETYRIYYPRIHSYVTHRISDTDEAEWLVQEVFRHFNEQLPTLDSSIPLVAHLFRIAHFLVTEWHRSRQDLEIRQISRPHGHRFSLN